MKTKFLFALVLLLNTVFTKSQVISISISPDTSVCSGQSVMIVCSPSGGTAPYTYAWSHSNGVFGGNPLVTPTSTTVYRVIVTDDLGATARDSVVITVNANPVVDSIYVKGVNCFDTSSGKACVFIDGLGGGGGNYNYAYSWWPGTTSTNPPSPCNGASLYIDSLALGSYTITVTNNNGCSAAANFAVGKDSIKVSFSAQSDGIYPDTLTANVTGGAPPYTYSWSLLYTTQSIEVLQAGMYGLTVVDSDNCTANANKSYPLPIQLKIAVIDRICLDLDSTIEMCSYAYGGVPPYSYQWTPTISLSNDTIPCPVVSGLLSSTTYTLIVTDVLGATVARPVTVALNSPKPVIDSFIAINVGCFGGADGSACPVISGGTPPYMYYTWSTGDLSMCHPLTSAGIYVLTVHDANGCSAIDTATITEPPQLKIDSITTTKLNCFGGAEGTACAVVSGGIQTYFYNWSIGTVSNCIQNLSAGLYFVTITDANGCTVIDSVEITEPSKLTAKLVSATGGILPDTLSVTISGGSQPYNYLWSVFQGTPSIIVYNPDCYIVIVEDPNGCRAFSDTICYDCTNYCVWPGDADYDGVVNNNDLLPIGLTYGATGLARFQTDIDWFGHPALNWNDTLNDTLNYKHIDCNGNGIINADDTLAIIQNYNLTHPRSGGVKPHRANTPELAITLSADSLVDGQTVVASLSLGSNAQVANNVYGIAFTFNYDANVVDTSHVGFVVNENSWLCNNASDHISINKKFVSGGKIAVGITRIDKASRSGSGEIATAILKITTGNINGKDLSYYKLNTYISDVRAVDNAGNIMDINEGLDSAYVAFTPTGINEVSLEQNSILLYPNPANKSIRFVLQNGAMEGWEIVSAEGRVVAAETFQISEIGKGYNADVSQLAKGVYFLKVNTKTGVVHGRFLKE